MVGASPRRSSAAARVMKALRPGRQTRVSMMTFHNGHVCQGQSIMLVCFFNACSLGGPGHYEEKTFSDFASYISYFLRFFVETRLEYIHHVSQKV